MIDPARTYLDATVQLAPDVTLFPGTILQGHTVVGERAEIGPDTRLTDCVVGRDAVVASSTGVDAEIGDGARVGPYAVLAAGSAIPDGAVTGPFYAARSPEDGAAGTPG
jgi:bifunctional UDP-N-acetylglucosamine pyrophosphorylase/glucosamine-1-phosphate N-acetyltransferase